MVLVHQDGAAPGRICPTLATGRQHLCFIEPGDSTTEYNKTAPNDTAYKQWRCHSGYKLLCKLCRNFPPRPPTMGPQFTVFFGKPAMRSR